MAYHQIVTRDVTTLFMRARNERRKNKFGGERVNQRLLDTDGRSTPPGVVVDIEMAATSLPPIWMDSADAAREDLRSIREQLDKLEKAQQKRLQKVFSASGAPDKAVESVSAQISQLVRRCEQSIHQIHSRGASGADSQIRENVQRNLATQLQQLSQQFRQAQKTYLGQIKERQQGQWDSEEPARSSSAGMQTGFSEAQLLQLEEMEMQAGQRTQEISQIASSISDLHTIFKELAVLVIDQGSILDRIDYNIEQVVAQSVEANKQLKKAEDSQKSNRAMKCIFALVLIDLILIIILIIKSRS